MKRLLATCVAVFVLPVLGACDTDKTRTSADQPSASASVPDPGSAPKSSHRVKVVLFGYPVGADPLKIKDHATCQYGMEEAGSWLYRGAEVQVYQGMELVDSTTLEGGAWRNHECTFKIDFSAHDLGSTPEFYFPEGDATYPISNTVQSEGPSVLLVN